jgi:type IV pilus assembly protein PilV
MMMLEVLIALLVFTIGVLGMVKMQAVSTANSVNSEDRATAALLANDLIAELWAAKSAAQPSDFSAWKTRVSSALRSGDGSTTTFSSATNTATIVITWKRQMGMDLESAASSTQQTATYATQVIIQ